MASYNGEKFIDEQIRSIISQSTEYEFRILISDDQSKDGTIDIVKHFASNYDNIIFISGPQENLGPKRRFEFLLQESSSDYIMFSDQDDVWLPNKVNVTMKKMLSDERRLGTGTPILVYSDLIIVDEKLNYISKSMRRHKNLRKNPSINSLLVENNVTGCTVMINRALLNHSLPFPDNIYMHDWWINLIANLYGSTSFVDESLILYRQHSSNTFGAGTSKEGIKSKMIRLVKSKDFRKSLDKSVLQAIELQKRLSENPNRSSHKIDFWIELQDCRKLKKAFYSFIKDYRPGGFWKGFLFMVRF